MEPRHGFVETPDVRLHYVDWGGDGPPLLLVHATGFHARLWDPYAEALRDRFRVIAMDQRGHGESSVPRNGFDWSHFGEDVHALILALDIEGCAAGGHSSGGTAVAGCAGLNPGSISRLLLLDPVIRPPRQDFRAAPAANSAFSGARRRRAIWESPEQFVEAMTGRGPFARWRPEYLELYARFGLHPREDGQYELACTPDSEAQVYENAGRHDPWPALRRLTIPSLYLRATRREGGPPPFPQGTAEAIPNCRLMEVDTTHFVPMEAPELVLEGMQTFLAD